MNTYLNTHKSDIYTPYNFKHTVAYSQCHMIISIRLPLRHYRLLHYFYFEDTHLFSNFTHKYGLATKGV